MLVTRYSLLVTSKAPPRAAGFTLLEIIVAIVILAVVVTTVLASFNMVFSSASTLEGEAAVFEMGKSTLARITRDLENIFVLEHPIYKNPAPDSLPDSYRIVGSVESIGGTGFAKLRFASRAHVQLGPTRGEGIAEIVYYVQPDPAGGLRLRRADHLYPYPRFEESSADPVLCENVRALAFEFIDAEGAALESWDSESSRFGYATPRLVAVRLELGQGEDTYVFQTMVALPLSRNKSG